MPRFIASLALVLLLTGGHARANLPCAIGAGWTLPLDGVASTISLTAQELTGGSFAAPNGQVYGPLPATCRVVAVISSNAKPAQSTITFEVWMPEQTWNGRFLGVGNGGFAGSIYWNMLQLGTYAGFAVANTELGTAAHGCIGTNCGDRSGQGGPVGGLYGDPAAIADFGGQATHLMTLGAKQVIAAYYGTPSSVNYFDGCSTGGQQGLQEAQRFPADYDGIIAGAPANNRTHLHMAFTQLYAVTHATASSYLTDAGLALAHGAMSSCLGHDGGYAHDWYLSQPPLCHVTGASLQCRGAAGEVPCSDPKAASCTCLPADAASALDTLYNGFVDSQGSIYYPGIARGAEEPVPLSAANSYVGDEGLTYQQRQAEPPYDSLLYWARGPSFQWPSLFAGKNATSMLSSAIAGIDATPVGGTTFQGALNAQSTDLSAFAARGGKLILFHGWADPLIPPAGTVDYVNAVNAADPKASTYLRLYMVPGLKHCTGGYGPNAFGNVYGSQLPPLPLDPSDDLLGAIVAWREHAHLPAAIIGTKYNNDDRSQGINHQRPLCPYPQHYQYQGGDWTKAASYTCVSGPPLTGLGYSGPYRP